MTPDHPKINYGKTGILIVNLGTPDSTSWLDIRKYLKEFLSDRRVIEVNPLIWQVILNLFILTFRPSKTAKAYKEIWMEDKNMSPLRYFTERQAEKLSNQIGNEDLIVDFAMRYGNPSIKSKIHGLQEKGCENLIVLPLYPQYAAATTATVCDEVYRTLMKMRWQPNLKIKVEKYLGVFKDHPYIFNLGHGILPETKIEMVEELIKIVRNFKCTRTIQKSIMVKQVF